jgi:hypothetical protein
MTLKRLFLLGALLVGLAGAAYLGQETTTPGEDMVATAESFLASLKPAQKKKAMLAYDSENRTYWNFIPMQDRAGKPTRKGLMLKEMTAKQKEQALALVKTGTSAEGYVKATTIMSLEAILHELEMGGRTVRDPEWYFFTIFGTPSKTGRWGWRVEGHHLSLNFTVDRGKVISSTPAFFGANPAKVMSGDRKGLRTLPESEDLAVKLFASLDQEQKEQAFHAEPFPEARQKEARAGVGKPVGLPASKMTKKQRQILQRLVEAYADRMPPAVGRRQIAEVRAAGIGKIHFAFYHGEKKRGKAPITYRVQGPTFVIEFLNTQSDPAGNPANHIHSCWRDLRGDFGLAAK